MEESVQPFLRGSYRGGGDWQMPAEVATILRLKA